MDIPDLVTIFGNLSQALYPVQNLITWVATLLGILFVLTALGKMKKMVVHGAHASSRDNISSPLVYLLIGVALIYLPSSLDLMANMAFGTGNILADTSFNKIDIRASVGLLIRTIGLVWFVRGCVLVAHASEPGSQHGLKGFLFLITGVFAINFDGSIAIANWFMQHLIDWTLNPQGH